MPSSESLLPGSSIRLFGRVLDDSLVVKASKVGGSLGDSLKRLPSDADGKLARIYGFSLDGQYVDLARPAIFLVHGGGVPVTRSPGGAGNTPPLAQTGVATEPPTFASDMLAWEYDREDFLLRIDVEVGPLERILLDAELGPDRTRYAGADVRLRQAGADVRLRHAGADVRLRGGRGGGLSD